MIDTSVVSKKTARTFSQNVNLSDPILSRFDLMCVLRDEADPLQERELMAHPISSPEIGGCLERHPIKHSKAFTKKNYGSKFQSPRYPKISKDLGCFGMDRAKLSPKMACACVTMI
jgi:hypothetical protein